MEQYDFKSDFTNSVFRLMGRILMVVILVQVLISLVSYLLTSLLAPEMANVGMEVQRIMQSGGDPSEWAEEIQNVVFGSGALSPGTISLLGLASLILTLISYNVIFNGIRNEVKESDNTIGAAINGFLDVRILKYVALYILMIISVTLILILVALSQSAVLIIIAMLIVIPIMVWFSISYAAVGIDNLSIGESIKIALSNMTVARLAKVLGIGIVTFIALAVAGMLIGLVSALLVQIPAVGPILGQIINAILGAVMMAFMLAGFSGLYYKYTNSLKSEEEFIVTD